MKNDFASIIKMHRKRLSLNQTHFAEKIGVSQGTVSRWERGGGIEPDQLIEVAARLGETVESLLGFEGGRDVPVVGFVGAGGEIVFEDAYERGGSLYEIGLLPGMKSDGLIGLEVRGDSMYPAIRDGHVAFFRRDGWDHVEDDALREWSVCRLKDGRTLLKEVRRSAEPDRYDLISTNAPPIEAVELEWATPVVGWRRR